MDISKMTQKQFEKHFAKKVQELADNMCMFCRYKAICRLPMYGNARWPANACPDWVEPDMETYFPMVTEHFFGKEITEKLMMKLMEEKYGL